MIVTQIDLYNFASNLTLFKCCIGPTKRDDTYESPNLTSNIVRDNFISYIYKWLDLYSTSKLVRWNNKSRKYNVKKRR